MSEALRPCPFCGENDIRIHRYQGAGRGVWHEGDDVWSMCCYDCGATFPNRYRKELLVECWNRRAAQSEQSAAPVIFVCPERDIECGSYRQHWCATCPKHAGSPPAPESAAPFAWATHHAVPMLFLTRAEAAEYCDDDESPIPLYVDETERSVSESGGAQALRGEKT